MLKFCIRTLVLSLLFSSYLFAQENTANNDKTKRTNSIVFQLKRAGVFETFLLALEKTGWLEKLSKAEQFTVFAPTDAAFVHVESSSRELIFSEKEILNSFVEQHIAAGLLKLNQLQDMQTVSTVAGLQLTIEKKSPITLAQAPIKKADIIADNGIIHVLGLARLLEK